MWRIPGSVINRTLRLLNRGLHILESVSAHADEQPLAYVPVFIIGAPRSGSTLLYQVMTDYYDFGYLSNLHCLFYGSPSFIERFIHPLQWRQPSDYTSRHGKIPAWTAPSECGEFWYRFFRRKPQYVPLAEAVPKKMGQLRAVIRVLGDAFGKPILFKNMNCALRLAPIVYTLPEALFIVIWRDTVDNAHSLLETRRNVYGNYTQWWSMEPPAIESLKKLPPHVQVVEQIRHIYALIDRERTRVGQDRFIDIRYEAFCNKTYESLNKIDAFFKNHGLHLERRIEVPKSFERRTQVRIKTDIYEQLRQYVQAKQ